MKKRADLILVERGLVPSRHQAASLILAGEVWSGEKRVEKAGLLLDPSVPIEIRKGNPYVSRGGLKLEGAFEKFQIDPRDKICLDVGASTGGFTDLLLQRGAKKIYAVDVGTGQLHPKLRSDPRVIVMEKSHILKSSLPETVDLVTADLSFISLTAVLPALKSMVQEKGRLILLVKPQFELTPREVKKGVVRDDSLREKAVQKVIRAATDLGYEVLDRVDSPLPGPKGNREVFLLLRIEGREKIG